MNWDTSIFGYVMVIGVFVFEGRDCIEAWRQKGQTSLVHAVPFKLLREVLEGQQVSAVINGGSAVSLPEHPRQPRRLLVVRSRAMAYSF